MKSKPSTKKKEQRREFTTIRHQFTNAERLELSERLVSTLQRITELEEQLATVAGEVRAKIKTEQAKAGELQIKLSNGHEMRDAECIVRIDRGAGMKYYHIHAPGKAEHMKEVREEPMTAADYEALPMEDLTPGKVKEGTETASSQKSAKAANTPKPKRPKSVIPASKAGKEKLAGDIKAGMEAPKPEAEKSA